MRVEHAEAPFDKSTCVCTIKAREPSRYWPPPSLELTVVSREELLKPETLDMKVSAFWSDGIRITCADCDVVVKYEDLIAALGECAKALETWDR